MRHIIILSLLVILPLWSFADCNATKPSSCLPPHGQSRSESSLQGGPRGLDAAVKMVAAVNNAITATPTTPPSEAVVSPGSNYCDSLSGRRECQQSRSSSSSNGDSAPEDGYRETDQ